MIIMGRYELTRYDIEFVNLYNYEKKKYRVIKMFGNFSLLEIRDSIEREL